jgi:hypothetical protein
VHGTRGSGVVIAAEVVPKTAIDLGTAITHELSHHLGLYHTTEQAGQVIDPLTDTPKCPLTRDGTNGQAKDGRLTPEECGVQGSSDGGTTNLMFWSTRGGILTSQQADVLRSAMILE